MLLLNTIKPELLQLIPLVVEKLLAGHQAFPHPSQPGTSLVQSARHRAVGGHDR